MFVVVSNKPEFTRKWVSVLSKWGGTRHADSLAACQIALRDCPASLVIFDFGLFEVVPSNLIQELHQRWSNTRLLLGGTHLEPLQELAALAAGAVACCDVTLQSEELEHIVGIVLQGGVWVSQTTLPLLVTKLQAFSARQATPATEPNRLSELTQRQREVAEMVGKGASNKHIARTLDISDRTVKAHLTAIFEKLGVTDRLHLALYVTSHNKTS